MTEAAGVGHNGSDDREVLYWHHMGALEDIEDRFDAIKEERRKARLVAKSDGFDLVSEIGLGMKLLRSEKTEHITGAISKQLRIVAYHRLAVGSQMDLFQQPAGDAMATDRAFTAGFQAGIMAKEAKPPQQFSDGDLAQAWMQGWHKGQERVRDLMQTRMEAANAADATAAEPKKRGRPAGSKNKPKEEPAELKKADAEDVRPRHLRQPGAASDDDAFAPVDTKH